MTDTPIKVEFDPTQPVGRRLVSTDEDGHHYEDMTLLEAVEERAAQIIAARVEKNEANLKAIAEKISEKVDALVDERLPALIDQALSDPLVVTDRWGTETGRGTLRDLIVAQVKQELVFKEDRYGKGTTLAKVVKDEIGYKLEREMAGAVQAAKKELTDRLRVTAAEVIAKSITDGLR